MSRPSRWLALALLGLATLAAAPGPQIDDDPDSYARLQAMPRERRVALSENLERFDKLDPAERAAIRKLDAEIARRDPVDQSRYRSLIRRYHLWVNGLTDDQKKALKDAGSDGARLDQAVKFRRKDREQGAPSGPRLFGIRTGDYGLVGPYEAVHLLRIWNKLAPAMRRELEKEPDRVRLFRAIRDQHKAVGVHFVPFPPAEEKLYDARLENDRAFKDRLGSYAQRIPLDPASKKADAAHAKGEAVPKKFAIRFTEFLYFEDHKPKPVAQKELERFSAACPDWLHALIDPLSADDARDYLTILYRLLYPEPGGMPAEAKPAKAPADSTAKPAKAAPKAPGQAGPF